MFTFNVDFPPLLYQATVKEKQSGFSASRGLVCISPKRYTSIEAVSVPDLVSFFKCGKPS